MIIVLNKKCSLNERLEIEKIARNHNSYLHWVPNYKIAVIEEKNDKETVKKDLEAVKGIKKIIEVTKPYKLASRDYKPEDSIINVDGVSIGGKEIALIAGPCALESEEQLRLAAYAVRNCGGRILRAGLFKPRTSPYSYQGIGEKGLKIVEKIKRETGVLVASEIIDEESLNLATRHIDIIQIGARNMQNFSLLKAAGKSGKPVLLKRGMSATIDEWLLAAEYILSRGNPNVILCERGIRTYEKATRNTLDLSAVPVAKELTHLPVIVDPSHAAGRSELISPLSHAAVAAGADGLLVEMHPAPYEALSDGRQSLNPEAFKIMTDQLRNIVSALGREIAPYPVSSRQVN